MFLRGLELHGFKTFAARTRFDFHGGLTAVVGPNGSGKSNLADAIRWALAEPAGRGLRVRRSEDLLFAGGAGRAPAGFAEVSLILDNRSGGIPLDYNEVTITRRLHRTGESEFSVNGGRSRLRDVVDLLARGGASSTYSVIGQGLIDAALSLRPEERRELIEEAADVRRHQSSLDDARSRLNATMGNLLRVDDIVVELGPRVDRLRKQAAEAAEHRRLATELADLLASLYAAGWRKAVKAVDGADAAARSAEAGLARARSGAQDVTDRLAACRAAYLAARTDLDRLLNELRRIESEADRARHEAAFAAQSVERLSAEEQRLAIETAEHRDRAEEELAALKESSDAVRGIRQEIAEIRSAVQERRNRANVLERAVAMSRDKLARMRRDVASTEADWSGDTMLAERLGTELRALGAPVQQFERAPELETLEQQLLALTAEERRQGELVARATAAKAEAEARQGELDQRRAAIRVELAGTAARLAELDKRLAAIAREDAAGDGLFPAVRAVMEQAGRRFANSRTGTRVSARPLTGIVGPVVELIEVPKGYELAFEAALGGRGQDIVVESWKEAEAAIEYLRQSGVGRATFLPLDTIQPGRPNTRQPEQGVHGLASQLARADGRYRSIVDRLLGNYVVVDDLTVARRCLNESGRGQQFVTLQGDLVGGWGSVTGGSSGGRRDGIWRRRAERATVETEQAEQAKRQRELSAEIDALDRTVSEIRSLIAETGAKREEQEQARSQAAMAVSRLAMQVERQRGLIEEQRQEAARRLQQREAIEKRLGEISARLDSHQAALEANREAAAVAEKELAVTEESYDQGLGDDLELVNQLAGLEATERNAESSLARIQSTADREKHLAERTERRLIELRQELSTAKRTVEQRKNDSASRTAEATDLQEQVRALSEARTSAEAGEAVLLTEEAAARQLLAAAQETAAAAARLVEQTTVEALTLQEKIEGDGLSVDALSNVEEEVADIDDLQRRVTRLRARLRSNPSIGYAIVEEFEAESGRLEHLRKEAIDLRDSEANLRKAILSLEELIANRFEHTFAAINIEFRTFFTRLFNGGSARLKIAGEDSGGSGIDIEAQPPGKRPQSLSALSGGERALTAAALICALLKVNPIPFCVLDEVDAALDEHNVRRFVEVIAELSTLTQFIVITHNRVTVEAASSVFGLAVHPDGSSRLVSLQLREATLTNA